MAKDIELGRDVATLVQTIDSKFLETDDLNITSFEVVQSDTDKIRKIFITNSTSYVIVVGVYVTNYSVVDNGTVKAIDRTDIVKTLQNFDQYIEHSSRLINIRVISDMEVDEYLNYRTILISYDTAIYELMWTFSTQQDTNPKTLISVSALYTFGDYGSSAVQRHVAVMDDYFAISYWDKLSEEYTVCVYYSQPQGPFSTKEV